MAKPTRKKMSGKSAKKNAKKKPARGKKTVAKAAPAKVAEVHDARHVVRERRFETRHLADKMTFASISLTALEFSRPGYSFRPEISALLVDVSEGGCSLVVMKSNPLSSELTKGARCVVQITPEGPRLAVLRWVKSLDDRLLNAGFQYEF